MTAPATKLRRNGHRRLSDALFECERAILELWDEGLPVEQIAVRLGHRPEYVAKIVGMYSHAAVEDLQDARKVRAASQALAAACIATGSRFR